ncbi:MAG TPA: hypothetical protein PLE19_04715 [Planctomycetota bacterium]|mgnify:CR=1 FL=1|nr:hypothetical protein [Planctomycetota bacterium]HRR79090.1 hypothetical protein [Planctomycetota bacterium]HRT93177.1 hypothetical protein [Planctomycetota bacterium]
MSEEQSQGAATAGWAYRLMADWRLQLLLGAVALGLAVALGMALGWPAPRKSAGAPTPDSMPQSHPISDSWRAMAGADVAAYLRCFTGEALAAREAHLARLGPEGFRKQLRAEAEAALGIEWQAPQPAPEGGLRFPVVVAHEGDEELFDYWVVKVGAVWKIRAVEPRGRRAGAPPRSDRLGPPATQGDQK